MALSTERTDTGFAAGIASLRPWIEVHASFRRRLVLGVVLMVLTALSALGLLAVSGWFITASALTGAALAAALPARAAAVGHFFEVEQGGIARQVEDGNVDGGDFHIWPVVVCLED